MFIASGHPSLSRSVGAACKWKLTSTWRSAGARTVIKIKGYKYGAPLEHCARPATEV